MSFGNILTVKPLLDEDQIKWFYESWTEPTLYREWNGLWRKQFKLVSGEGRFIALNKRIPRPGFRKLKKAATALVPVHIYASVLKFLMPERVEDKEKTKRAYPVGGEFVIDIDHYMNYQPHSHRTEPEGFCYGCIKNARTLALSLGCCLREL